MSHLPDPVHQLPRPVEIHAHIGRLLRELRLARRLLRISQSVNAEREATSSADRKAVADDR